MNVAMRAPMTTALRSRTPLPLATLVIALMVRTIDSGRVDWFGSDMQFIAAAILYGALVPVFVTALASAWLRGDAGPWSWALARPVSRTRWLGMMLLVDIATIAACVGAAWLVLGSLPHTWVGPWRGGVRMLAYLALLIAVYAAAAIAGARGASALGASIYVLGGCALLSIAATVADELLFELTYDPEPRALAQLAAVVLVATACALLAIRAAQRVPAPPPPRGWILPLVAATVLGATAIPLLFAAMH